ncbi:MAG TPA: septum formation initiator [Flavobacteriales bacterium]|jgi:cell division protein DivIC|nr:septum formation initiator [Flavobacteriales bacterium]
MFSKLYSSLPGWSKNRYALSVLIFTIWMLFFDQNDLFSLYKMRRELNQIEHDKAFYQDQIEKSQKDLSNLLNDPKKLEKFAREKYLMKKEDEEIFVIVVEE